MLKKPTTTPSVRLNMTSLTEMAKPLAKTIKLINVSKLIMWVWRCFERGEGVVK